MSKTKIYTWYLPQFHQIPENDAFWGKGFTDWVTVRNSKPLFKGHDQPRIPKGGKYYDLSCPEDVINQVRLARDNGISGFGIYHYWFNNEKNLLTRPAEIIRENPELDVKYFFAWDNATWKRTWSNVYGNAWAPIADDSNSKRQGSGILIPYVLGEEPDWRNHYNWLRPFFQDSRYLKQNGKPVFVILQYDENIQRMCDFWDSLAREEGYPGMVFIFKYSPKTQKLERQLRFIYEPIYSGWSSLSYPKLAWDKLIRMVFQRNTIHIYNYDKIWKKILRRARLNTDQNIIYSGFVSYDDTPRRGYRGTLVKGSTPKRFGEYMAELMRISQSQGKEILFVTAWNEWGEGAYLEPDEMFGMGYLDEIRKLTKD